MVEPARATRTGAGLAEPVAPVAGLPPLILVADDLPENRRLLARLLEPHGFRVDQAQCGREVLERVAARPPDLILLDLLMPEGDGFDVCARLKRDERTRLIPVVVVTALPGDTEKLRAIESGADDFLHKPISQAELLARVQALLRLKRYTDELEHAEATLVTLSLTVESRDPYTQGHCQRLAAMGVGLGRRVGLPEESLRALHRGGYLHDIGKIAVPDAILFKPGRLTEAEWAVMRRHTVVGEEICRPLRSLAAVLPIIRSHHERWDGSGYPDGLAGEDIPALARILQIVDVYDALRTERPYKVSLRPADALAQMQREAEARRLDPRLFMLFRQHHDDILAALPAPASD
jgi:putative two-component system response regulator